MSELGDKISLGSATIGKFGEVKILFSQQALGDFARPFGLGVHNQTLHPLSEYFSQIAATLGEPSKKSKDGGGKMRVEYDNVLISSGARTGMKGTYFLSAEVRLREKPNPTITVTSFTRLYE